VTKIACDYRRWNYFLLCPAGWLCFAFAKNFNQDDLSAWDTGKVIDMSSMFFSSCIA
jgi:surface protein